MPGTTEIIIIFSIIILLFGANRLPNLSKSLGESVRNFRMIFANKKKPNRKSVKDQGD